MARQKLGAFKRIKQKRIRKLVEKKEKIEKLIAEDEAAAAPAKAAVAELAVARKEAIAAQNKSTNMAAKVPKLVSPEKAATLQHTAAVKAAVVKQLEEKVEATPVPAPKAPSDLEASLNVFDWTVLLLEAGADELKISKWYAVGGAALLAVLYFVAEKQGWVDFINF